MNESARSVLTRQIDLILSEVDVSVPVYKIIPAPGAVPRSRGESLVLNPGDAEVENEQVELLKKLYSQQPADLAVSFPQLLLKKLTRQTSIVIVVALIEIGGFDAVLSKLEEPLRDVHLRIALWVAVEEAVSKQPHRFRDEVLMRVSRARAADVAQASRLVTGIAPPPTTGGMSVGQASVVGVEQRGNLVNFLDAVDKIIMRIQYLRLRQELQGVVNPEINTDRLELISRIEEIGFRREIADALRDLEPRLLAAAKPLDFKSCVDIIRTIFEEIVEDAAKKAAVRTSKTIPSGKVKDFQPWKDLLVTTAVLTPEEGDLFQKFYNYCSNVGTHRLGSHHEHVRIVKNTAIEWGLLIVGRVQGLAAR